VPVTRPTPPATRRVFLHVGSPKTGTTFLQNVLWSQRGQAREQGLLLPLERFADHYLASLDLRGLSDRPEHPQRAVGIWERLVRESSRWEGTVLVSHELFAAATPEQARRAVSAFGDDAEVHVVLTARDLVRQMSAEWQEHVKHRSVQTYAEFVTSLREDRGHRSWFWRVQDFADVLDRWGSTLPRERVHVVTVPPSGASPVLLWERFATLLGLDPTAFDTRQGRSNTSLGVEQAELLRRLNAVLGERLPLPGPYPAVVKNLLAHRVLAARPGTPLALSPEDTDYAVSASREVAQRLEALGVDVVGDLAELVPDADEARDRASATAYEPPADAALLEESVEALAGVLTVMADRRAQRRYEDLIRDLKARPVRFALARAAERNRALGQARKAYRRATRR
jgi:hypothetical protein